MAAVGVLALLIRLALHGDAFDVYGDEVIYADLGRSVVSGGFPRFFGEPFFLHGPAFFYLEAGWAHIWGTPRGLVPWIYEMRTLNALLAAATAVVVVLLGARASTPWAGVAAGLIFCLDPFCIRQNDRVLLETAMMFWVLLGYLVFSPLLARPGGRSAWVRAIAAGLLFGCAVLTKDEAALLTLLPLLAYGLIGRGPRRPLIGTTMVAAIVPYGCYVAVVASGGYFPGWWSAKTSGVMRLLGVVQTTGFHAASGGSLSGRLISEGPSFATTYLVLALAVPALVIVLRRGQPAASLLGILHLAAVITLVYALTLGTLEEQELYLLIVPSVLILPVSVTLLRPARTGQNPAAQNPGAQSPAALSTSRLSPVLAAGAGLLAIMLGLNLFTAVQWLRQPDDGFARLLPYMAAHVPPGSTVTIAAASYPIAQTDAGRYALMGRYKVGLWWTPAALQREHVRYVLAEWGPISEGYSYLQPTQVRRLVRRGTLIFSFDGRSYGRIALYKLPSAQAAVNIGSSCDAPVVREMQSANFLANGRSQFSWGDPTCAGLLLLGRSGLPRPHVPTDPRSSAPPGRWLDESGFAASRSAPHSVHLRSSRTSARHPVCSLLATDMVQYGFY